MDEVDIYLDESGDLGWTFDREYRKGGSSRHLTISAVIVDHSLRQHPKRVIKRLYEKLQANPQEEVKWATINHDSRVWLASRMSDLKVRLGNSIEYRTITVKKENVQTHIRNDSNKLYNFMTRLMLLDAMARHRRVNFFPDQRTIKVQSGNSLHDYLQTELWFNKRVETVLKTVPCDSKNNLCLQFADMLAGMAQSCYEDGKSGPMDIIRRCAVNKTLFF